MTDLATPPASTGPGTHASNVVARRRQLPGGRSVVGGFLVAAAAAGVFATWTSASSVPLADQVVVRRDIAAGERLTSAALALVPMDLPDAQAGHAFGEADLELLDGATALAPLAAGQLVQRSDVAKNDGAPLRAQVALRLEPGDAVGGKLRPGDEVDVIATYTAGGAPETTTISAAARVVEVIADEDRVGSTGALVVVLAVLPDELEAVASATAAGHVTLARVTGVDR